MTCFISCIVSRSDFVIKWSAVLTLNVLLIELGKKKKTMLICKIDYFTYTVKPFLEVLVCLKMLISCIKQDRMNQSLSFVY